MVPLWPIVVWAVAAAQLIQGSFWHPAVDQTMTLLGARQSTLLMSSFLLPYNVSWTGTWTCDLISFLLPPRNLSSRLGGKYPMYVSIYWAFFSWSSFFIWRKLLRPRRLCHYFCTTTSFFLPLPHLSLSLSLIFILVCGLKWKKTDSFLRKAAFFSLFFFFFFFCNFF